MEYVKSVILQTHTNGKRLNKVLFITEIASTHAGSKKELNSLIKEIIKNSSDFVKFQIFNNNDLCHITSPLYSGLKKIELPYSYWNKIIVDALKVKKVILEPFDYKSFEFCKKFKNKALIKISSSEHDNTEMIIEALKNFKKVFFNISGLDLKELKIFLKKIDKYKKKIIFMYGFQSFPSDPKDLRLGLIKEMKKLGVSTGYADHSKTDDHLMTYLLTSKAIDLGANYVEKHITLKRRQKKPDYISSFEPKDLEKYVLFFKKKYTNNFIKKISNKEKIYCNIMGKFGVAVDDFSKNEKLNIKKVKFLRTGKVGISRESLSDLLNNKSRSKKLIKKNEILQEKFFYQK